VQARAVGPEPHTQVPPWHVSPVPHARPHMPQFAASLFRSTQPDPQHAWPVTQGPPVLPHWQTPPRQLSPIPQRTPTPPQLFGSLPVLTQVNVPASGTQSWPVAHWSSLPHMQRGVPAPPPGTEQALTRIVSHAMPHPLHEANEGSARPSLPIATPLRDTQV